MNGSTNGIGTCDDGMIYYFNILKHFMVFGTSLCNNLQKNKGRFLQKCESIQKTKDKLKPKGYVVDKIILKCKY